MLLLATLVGCSSPARVGFRPIQVDMTFRNVETPTERARIEQAIAREARNGRFEAEQEGTDLRMRFEVLSLDALERLHPVLIFPGGPPRRTRIANPFRSAHDPERRYNDDRPSFSVVYETARLDAALEIIVRFRITPGAELFYVTSGRGEQKADLPENHDGNIRLRTRIAPGQRAIYGRTVLGGVERFIRVDVFTQEVQRISRSEYPG